MVVTHRMIQLNGRPKKVYVFHSVVFMQCNDALQIGQYRMIITTFYVIRLMPLVYHPRKVNSCP